LTKAILDALTFAKVFDDDEQVDELVVKRAEAVPPGQLVVTVAALEGQVAA
jgi:Holliday junction resolvase RusA-like endonuclease